MPGLACITSVIAWSGHEFAIPLSLLFLLLLGMATTRRVVYAMSVAYYAGATWQIIPGAAAFFGHHSNPIQVFGLWASVSLVLAGPWAVLWSKRRTRRVWTAPLTILLLAVPPLGLIGCASPLVAGGLIFPGMAWFGFGLILLISGFLCSYPAIAAILALAISIPAQLLYHAPLAPHDWQAANTHFGGVGLDVPTPFAEYQAAQRIQGAALASDAHVIVFPETVVTNWNPGTDLFWNAAIEALRSQGKTILVGANVFDSTSQHYLNSIIIRGAEERPDFIQRIPIPIAMWKPFSKAGVPLRLGGQGTIEIAGQKPAILICYEQLLVWPAVTSFMSHPNLLLGMANDYWARTTRIPEIQRACLEGWARLFGVALLWAQNS